MGFLYKKESRLKGHEDADMNVDDVADVDDDVDDQQEKKA